MSKYKKLFGFVFTISICLSSLTACGDSYCCRAKQQRVP